MRSALRLLMQTSKEHCSYSRGLERVDHKQNATTCDTGEGTPERKTKEVQDQEIGEFLEVCRLRAELGPTAVIKWLNKDFEMGRPYDILVQYPNPYDILVQYPTRTATAGSMRSRSGRQGGRHQGPRGPGAPPQEAQLDARAQDRDPHPGRHDQPLARRVGLLGGALFPGAAGADNTAIGNLGKAIALDVMLMLGAKAVEKHSFPNHHYDMFWYAMGPTAAAAAAAPGPPAPRSSARGCLCTVGR